MVILQEIYQGDPEEDDINKNISYKTDDFKIFSYSIVKEVLFVHWATVILLKKYFYLLAVSYKILHIFGKVR